MFVSLQFSNPGVGDAEALGSFWPQIRENYPNLERQAPITAASEDFGFPPPQPSVQFEFGVGSASPPQRYWFLSADGHDLVQVQHDRLVVNWRRLATDQPYPRYDHVRDSFCRVYPVFIDAIGVQPSVSWCEVSYINEIEAPADSGHGHMELSRVLRLVAQEEIREFRPAPEDTQYQERYILRDGKQEPYGRLYISATPAFRTTTNVPLYIINMLVRGRPQSDSFDSLLDFFDKGRALIVQSFKEITTREMHNRWGLITHQ